MKTRRLGKAGPDVSAIGLGCMGMAAFYGQGLEEAQATAVIHRALDVGVNFLDTAEMYGPHTNEIQIGKALADRRDKAFVATKFGIGFNAEVRSPDLGKKVGEALREVEPDDLVKFGLIPEFIGRLPVVATLEDLDEKALIEILTKPKNALVKQYGRLFEMEGAKLTFTEDALRAVATRAIQRKTGARGLRSILESILLDTMFELPGLETVEEVVVNREVAESRAQPLFIYGERAAEQSSA